MRTSRTMRLLVFGILLGGVALLGSSCPGFRIGAYVQLQNAGVAKYLGQFTPVSSTPVGDGWTRHDFDPDGGNGPICIAGSPYSIYTRDGDPSKLLIFEQGGGACWQDFYNCNIVENNPLPPFPQVDDAGIWNRANASNPFADYSIVYLPYCDGSTFWGDNELNDPSFPFGPVRYHRGLRNLTVGMDLARSLFPDADQVTVAGVEGGAGAMTVGPFLARFAYGNQVSLTVLGDAPLFVPANLNDASGVAARAADWQFGQFFPASCQECDDMGQTTRIIDWGLRNDTTVREAYYETDADLTNRFFLGLLGDQQAWRDLIVTEHGLLNEDFPDRYKRFIVANDTSHTALQTLRFYTQTADGVLLNEWTADFLDDAAGWVDIVEEP